MASSKMKKRIEGLKRLRYSAGIDGYPLPPIHEEQEPANALVITCSESPILSAFLASLDPACTLQNLGGTLPAPDSLGTTQILDSGWSTVAYAIERLGLRHVVFTGHSTCHAPTLTQSEQWVLPGAELISERMTVALQVSNEMPEHKRLSQIWLVSQMVRLSNWLGQISNYRHTDIAMHALWFDEDQGDTFTYSRDAGKFLLMSDIDMERLFGALESANRVE